MDLQLKGRRALVTGGSRGIGKVIARHLAQEGVDVVIAARGAVALQASATELAAATGQRIVALSADTASKAAVDTLVADAVQALGGLDIVVNAAAVPGGSGQGGGLAETADEDLLNDFDVKVVGYLRVARAAAPHLLASAAASPSRGSRIVNIGGLAAYRSGRPAATLRNIGVSALTKTLADELGPRGVHVFAIHPGATRTERTDDAAAARAGQANTIGRIVDAAEIADLVAFLASPRSAALNGSALHAGGGSPGVIHY
jgi:NAD(P)-dependent dehydrogenase (short-subunit alcohol dehydrogenase family)